MKKLLVLVLAAALALSLVACGGGTGDTPSGGGENNVIDKSTTDAYIGVWESAHMRFTVNKGGIGRYEQPTSTIGYFDFTYEVKDEVLVITIPSSVTDYTASFELNDEGTALTILQNGLPSYYSEESEFIKKEPSNSEEATQTKPDETDMPSSDGQLDGNAGENAVPSNGEWDEILCSGDGYHLVKKEVDAYNGYSIMVGAVDDNGEWVQELTDSGIFAKGVQSRASSQNNPTLTDSTCYFYLGEGVFLASPGVTVFTQDEEYRVGPWENALGNEFEVWECLLWNVTNNAQRRIGANKISVIQDGYLLFCKEVNKLGGGTLNAMNTDCEVTELPCKFMPNKPVHNFPVYSEGVFFACKNNSTPGFFDIGGNLAIDLRECALMEGICYSALQGINAPYFEDGQATVLFKNNGGSVFKGIIDKTGAFVGEPEKIDG